MSDSNLVKHAREELKLLGCNEEDIADVLKVVEAFASIQPSGGQASWLIPVINDLLLFNNLSPLTNDPKEWIEVGDGIWQNSRNSEAFSDDGGKTFWLLSEGATSENRQPYHDSVAKEQNSPGG